MSAKLHQENADDQDQKMPHRQFSLASDMFSAFAKGLAEVIADPGHVDTPHRLCDAVRQIVPFDYAGAFVFRRNSGPSRLFDEVETEPVPYLDSPYLLDPIYDRVLNDDAPLCCRARDVVPGGFGKSEYYRTYYRHLDIVDEYYFNIPLETQSLAHITIMRCGDSRKFSAKALSILEACSPILVSVMKKFARIQGDDLVAVAQVTDAFHERLVKVLRAFGTSILTVREKEILDLSLRGHSDKSTARELEISPGTVRNHKKRIYGKLGATSQGQIFNLSLEALQQSSSIDAGDDPLSQLAIQ